MQSSFPDKTVQWILLKLLSDHFKVRNANLASLDITTLKTTKKKTNIVTSLHKVACMILSINKKTWHNLLSPSLPLHGPVSF
jgi:hypothetical protein